MPRKFRNTRRENRLEELGRVDAERADTAKGKRNLREEKDRIRSELAIGGRAKKPKAGPRAPREARKPRTQSTLTGTGKEHGGGPDAGNIGHNKDFIYKAGKLRKKLKKLQSGLGRMGPDAPRQKPKSKVSPGRPGRKGPRIDKRWNKGDKFMTPLRAKKAKGGKAKGPNRPRPTGPHMWVRGEPKRKKYASGGVVMAGKKVGCQIK